MASLCFISNEMKRFYLTSEINIYCNLCHDHHWCAALIQKKQSEHRKDENITVQVKELEGLERKGGGGEWQQEGRRSGWVAKWWSDMSLSYEARVAVGGELASPKSFPRLILNNMDDRDKRETHQKLARFGTKKDYSPQSASLLQTLSILVTFGEIRNMKITPFTVFFCKPGNAQQMWN